MNNLTYPMVSQQKSSEEPTLGVGSAPENRGSTHGGVAVDAALRRKLFRTAIEKLKTLCVLDADVEGEGQGLSYWDLVESGASRIGSSVIPNGQEYSEKFRSLVGSLHLHQIRTLVNRLNQLASMLEGGNLITIKDELGPYTKALRSLSYYAASYLLAGECLGKKDSQCIDAAIYYSGPGEANVLGRIHPASVHHGWIVIEGNFVYADNFIIQKWFEHEHEKLDSWSEDLQVPFGAIGSRSRIRRPKLDKANIDNRREKLEVANEMWNRMVEDAKVDPFLALAKCLHQSKASKFVDLTPVIARLTDPATKRGAQGEHLDQFCDELTRISESIWRHPREPHGVPTARQIFMFEALAISRDPVDSRRNTKFKELFATTDLSKLERGYAAAVIRKVLSALYGVGLIKSTATQQPLPLHFNQNRAIESVINLQHSKNP